MTADPRVGIVLGSDSDLDVMLETVTVLEALDIGCEVVVASAHRTPDRAHEYAINAERRGLRVLVAGAGGAAALPGFLASLSALPVIGVPIDASPLGGLDALLSIAQMPKGVPVATMSIGKWGAANAGILAAQIIATADDGVRSRLVEYRRRLAAQVDERAARVAEVLKKRA